MARTILFGQARFGARVLEGLVTAGHEVTAVCLPERREGRPDPLAEAAERAGLRVVARRSYRGSEAVAEVAAAQADLAVLAYVTQIIPLEILDAPRFGSVCFHPSLLPAYRGGSAINWQLIRGETRGGITLFRPDAGIDAGPIYLQRELAIGPDDSAGGYYYGTVFEPGVAATIEAVEGVVTGELNGVPQDERLATYDPLCRDEHARVDWTRPAADLHNLVRGCDPSPGAHARWKGERVRLYGSRRTGTKCGRTPPGTVVTVGEGGIEVAAGDETLVFAKLALGGRGKAAAEEIARDCGLRVGERLDPGSLR